MTSIPFPFASLETRRTLDELTFAETCGSVTSDREKIGHSYLRNEKKTGSSSPSQRLLGVLLGTGKNRPIADQRGLCNDPRNNWGRIWAAVAFVVSKVAYSRLRVWLFGRIQDYILDLRFFGFITTKETKIRKWILQCDSNSEFTQQDGKTLLCDKRDRVITCEFCHDLRFSLRCPPTPPPNQR